MLPDPCHHGYEWDLVDRTAPVIPIDLASKSKGTFPSFTQGTGVSK